MADINELNEAIILCGGKGTRLKEVVNDVPKPLAPIDGIPFLSILMKYLKAQGIRRVILATGYMHEKIENLYGNCYEGMEIVYSVEQNPLGTGGAIAKALKKVMNENVLTVLIRDKSVPLLIIEPLNCTLIHSSTSKNKCIIVIARQTKSNILS